MFRAAWMFLRLWMRFPRIRGDVPKSGAKLFPRCPFSPHTRGCSAILFGGIYVEEVFPAYAGMFRCGGRGSGLWCRFPRIRGDVPPSFTPKRCSWPFSPHTRGCSGILSRGIACGLRFPRIRGDVPLGIPTQQSGERFSPHTRGCSGY